MAHCRVTNCTIQLTHIASHVKAHNCTTLWCTECTNLSVLKQCHLLVISLTATTHWSSHIIAELLSQQLWKTSHLCVALRDELEQFSNRRMAFFPVNHCAPRLSMSAGLNLNRARACSSLSELTGRTCWPIVFHYRQLWFTGALLLSVCLLLAKTQKQIVLTCHWSLWISVLHFNWAITETNSRPCHFFRLLYRN